YQQRGGEDAVVAAETQLLESRGHDIVRYERHSNDLRGQDAFALARAGINAMWASDSYHAVKNLLRREKPNLAHFHNIFPLISPAAYYACSDLGVPVVQTLHNYRLLCPGANFLRDGRICESCVGHEMAWPAIAHGCYRDSRLASFSVAATSALHKRLRTWND